MDALLRFLADQEHVPLAELPERLLDAKLLTALDGSVEIGSVEEGSTMYRGECISTGPKWTWRSPAAPGYAPLRTYLPEIVSAGWHVRLTERGRVEAARLAAAVAPVVTTPTATEPDQDLTDEAVTPSKLADRLRIPKDDKGKREALRKRLEYWREENPNGGWIENANACGRQPRYLYPLRTVLPIVEDMRHFG